ncbi:MAG TPA: hypothetical protein PKW55_00760 [Spirochaetota bacterium]|nr:hypothetical protein [Spirochaetota bacterium]HOM39027.1 hypothetical protein [Spirochaetota bacterium]HPQ49920.1 hypothetical protein [Spirochaetota bacterium]
MKKKFFSIVSFTLFYSVILFGGEAYHGANFIKNRVGARSIALGISYVGFIDGPYSLFYNPAGLLNYDSIISFGGGYDEYQNIESSGVLSLISEDFGIAFGFLYKNYDDIFKYDSSGTRVSPIKNDNILGVFGFAASLTDFSSLGLNFKFGYRTIDDIKYMVLASNFGLMANVLFFQISFGIDNIGVNYENDYKTYNFVNPDFYLGISYIDTNQENEKVFGVGFGIKRGVDLPNEETRIGFGSFIRLFSAAPELIAVLEKKDKVTVPNSFYLNIGIEKYHGINFSVGFSLILWGFQTDYALTFPTEDKKEFSHYVTLLFKF